MPARHRPAPPRPRSVTARLPQPWPAGRLRPLLDEPVANRAFADLGKLEGVLVEQCWAPARDRRAVKAYTRFHCWPREQRPQRRQRSAEIRITY